MLDVAIARAQTTRVNGLNYGWGQPCIANYDTIIRIDEASSIKSLHFCVLHTNYKS